MGSVAGWIGTGRCDPVARKKGENVVNRGALLLRYKAPAVQWINEADPAEDGTTFTLDQANRERTVYLISEAAGDSDADLRRWIQANYQALWENELEGWYTDEALWPEQRTLKKFHQWFDVECHTVLLDTVGDPIVDDEI